MRGNVKVYQKKIVDRRRKRFFFLCLWGLLFVGLILSGLSYLSQLDSLTLHGVNVEGTSRLDSSRVNAIALNDIAGNYGYFFSKRNVFLYPRNTIERDIAALPLVKEVRVKGDGEKGLVISVTERSEAALWCDADKVSQKGCFSVDENGFIFAAATSTSGVIYTGVLAGNEKIGLQVMSKDDFKNMQFFMRELVTLGVGPTEVLMEDAGYMEISLRKGGKLIINTVDDLSSVLSNLSSVLSDKSIVPDLDSFLGNLSYMRLDSGNKIFYKTKTATSSKK